MPRSASVICTGTSSPGRFWFTILAQQHLERGDGLNGKLRPTDATIVDWIRQCKRAGLYQHGKLLYEKGRLNRDNLSEKEDYRVCLHALKRLGKGTRQATDHDDAHRSR